MIQIICTIRRKYWLISLYSLTRNIDIRLGVKTKLLKKTEESLITSGGKNSIIIHALQIDLSEEYINQKKSKFSQMIHVILSVCFFK